MILYHGTNVDFDIIDHIVDKMTIFLIQDFCLSIPEALNVIYNSETYRLINDKDNGLYTQSPSYLYELLKKEYLTATVN